MKKITMLVSVLMMSIFTFAQDIVLVNNDQLVEKGSTIVLNAEVLNKEDDLGPYVEVNLTTSLNKEKAVIKFKNVSGTENTFTATVEKVSCDFSFLSWCFNQCDPIETSFTKNGTLAAGASADLGIDVFPEEKEYGSAKVKLTINDGSADNFYFIVLQYKESTGIQNEKLNQSCNVINNNFIYTFEDSANRQLNIYNIAGLLVKTEALNQSGSLLLTDLDKGLYIYEVSANGKPVFARKCVVE